MSNDERALMAQSENDSAPVKQLKWDFHTLERLRRDYAEPMRFHGIDITPLQTELVAMVVYIQGK